MIEYILNEENNGNQFFIEDSPILKISDQSRYEAKIIADSLNQYGSRLTTIVVTYPRFVHSELMTHREFSRNAASSRAIPINKVIEQVLLNPAMPYKWQTNQRGMQGGEELSENLQVNARHYWIKARNLAVEQVKELSYLGCHKQVANRLLEPFVWMTTVISSTSWNNFFHLRCSDLADPTIRHIAEMIRYVIKNHTPDNIENDEWHLPFVSQVDYHDALMPESHYDLRKISVARCARVSYLNHGSQDIEKDLELATRLEQSGHWSAFEHVAQPVYFAMNKKHGNFSPTWIQYRKTFEGEYVK
jgi:thymidylate synthase ThyX